MKIIESKLQMNKKSILYSDSFYNDTLFFSIETTGLTACSSFLYLIGTVYQKDNYFYFRQFFSENLNEEEIILSEFITYLRSFKNVLSFHGVGFDLPYLENKCNKYQIAFPFDQIHHVDILNVISNVKSLLKLSNYKQTTIERFFDFYRDDLLSGKELIAYYKEYLSSSTEEIELLLLHHNYNNLLGLIKIVPVLSYQKLFDGEFELSEFYINNYRNYQNEICKELIVKLKCKNSVPKEVSCIYNQIFLIMFQNTAQVRIPIYEGELFYFYENYKEYYYLPDEDVAIHKNVATYVDKNHRKKATPDNCYTRKTGIFLPQYDNFIEPAFRKNRKEKISYFEIQNNFKITDYNFHSYICHILDGFHY